MSEKKKVISFRNPGVNWRVFEHENLEKYIGPVGEVAIGFDEGSKEAFAEEVYASWREHAEFALWRPNTEETTDAEVAWMIKAEEKLGLPSINSPKSFYNYHAKDEAFKIWDKLDIPFPPYFVFEDAEEFNKKIQALEFPVLVRLNNQCTGDYSYFCEDLGTAQKVIKVLPIIRDSFRHKGLSYTRMMCAQFIDTNKDGYNYSYRIIVAGNKVVTGYARLSSPKDWIAITGKFTPAMSDKFVEYNRQCEEFCRSHEEEIVKTVHSLGLNHQGVDVIFDTEGNHYYLEVQPGYSCGYANAPGWDPPFYNPSYPELVKFLTENSEKLREELPLYYNNWLDKDNLFRNVHKNIKEYFDEKETTVL